MNDLILVGRKVDKLSMSWISFSIVFERPAISIELIETVKRKKYDAERERFLNKCGRKTILYILIFFFIFARLALNCLVRIRLSVCVGFDLV